MSSPTHSHGNGGNGNSTPSPPSAPPEWVKIQRKIGALAQLRSPLPIDPSSAHSSSSSSSHPALNLDTLLHKYLSSQEYIPHTTTTRIIYDLLLQNPLFVPSNIATIPPTSTTPVIPSTSTTSTVQTESVSSSSVDKSSPPTHITPPLPLPSHPPIDLDTRISYHYSHGMRLGSMITALHCTTGKLETLPDDIISPYSSPLSPYSSPSSSSSLFGGGERSTPHETTLPSSSPSSSSPRVPPHAPPPSYPYIKPVLLGGIDITQIPFHIIERLYTISHTSIPKHQISLSSLSPSYSSLLTPNNNNIPSPLLPSLPLPSLQPLSPSSSSSIVASPSVPSASVLTTTLPTLMSSPVIPPINNKSIPSPICKSTSIDSSSPPLCPSPLPFIESAISPSSSSSSSSSSQLSPSSPSSSPSPPFMLEPWNNATWNHPSVVKHVAKITKEVYNNNFHGFSVNNNNNNNAYNISYINTKYAICKPLLDQFIQHANIINNDYNNHNYYNYNHKLYYSSLSTSSTSTSSSSSVPSSQISSQTPAPPSSDSQPSSSSPIHIDNNNILIIPNLLPEHYPLYHPQSLCFNLSSLQKETSLSALYDHDTSGDVSIYAVSCLSIIQFPSTIPINIHSMTIRTNAPYISSFFAFKEVKSVLAILIDYIYKLMKYNSIYTYNNDNNNNIQSYYYDKIINPLLLSPSSYDHTNDNNTQNSLYLQGELYNNTNINPSPQINMNQSILNQFPDILIADANGLHHPLHAGLASHIEILTGLPTIGIAKNAFHLRGVFHDMNTYYINNNIKMYNIYDKSYIYNIISNIDTKHRWGSFSILPINISYHHIIDTIYKYSRNNDDKTLYMSDISPNDQNSSCYNHHLYSYISKVYPSKQSISPQSQPTTYLSTLFLSSLLSFNRETHRSNPIASLSDPLTLFCGNIMNQCFNRIISFIYSTINHKYGNNNSNINHANTSPSTPPKTRHNIQHTALYILLSLLLHSISTISNHTLSPSQLYKTQQPNKQNKQHTRYRQQRKQSVISQQQPLSSLFTIWCFLALSLLYIKPSSSLYSKYTQLYISYYTKIILQQQQQQPHKQHPSPSSSSSSSPSSSSSLPLPLSPFHIILCLFSIYQSISLWSAMLLQLYINSTLSPTAATTAAAPATINNNNDLHHTHNTRHITVLISSLSQYVTIGLSTFDLITIFKLSPELMAATPSSSPSSSSHEQRPHELSHKPLHQLSYEPSLPQLSLYRTLLYCLVIKPIYYDHNPLPSHRQRFNHKIEDQQYKHDIKPLSIILPHSYLSKYTHTLLHIPYLPLLDQYCQLDGVALDASIYYRLIKHKQYKTPPSYHYSSILSDETSIKHYIMPWIDKPNDIITPVRAIYLSLGTRRSISLESAIQLIYGTSIIRVPQPTRLADIVSRDICLKMEKSLNNK